MLDICLRILIYTVCDKKRAPNNVKPTIRASVKKHSIPAALLDQALYIKEVKFSTLALNCKCEQKILLNKKIKQILVGIIRRFKKKKKVQDKKMILNLELKYFENFLQK